MSLRKPIYSTRPSDTTKDVKNVLPSKGSKDKPSGTTVNNTFNGLIHYKMESKGNYYLY